MVVDAPKELFDPFAAYSPPKKRQLEVADEGSAQPNRTVQQQARLLAHQELKLWRQPNKGNRVKKPLLPKKKEERFNPIEWWAETKNVMDLQRLAITNLIVHASSQRAGVLGSC